MKRMIIATISVIVVIGAMFTAIMLTKNNNTESPQTITTQEIAEENILDDCTDEYEEISEQNMIQANTEDEKISPNCAFIQKVTYKKCGHTISQYLELPEELVNMSKQQISEKYSDWKVEEFLSNKVILSKDVDAECGEHYLVKDNEGKVTIYKIAEDGTENKVEETDVSTEYLTETDKVNMKNGIKVNGKQELNQLIEDFE